MKKLEEIRKRANATRKGPWNWDDDNSWYESTVEKEYVSEHGGYERLLCDRPQDRQFIEHAREDIDYLLRLVDMLDDDLCDKPAGQTLADLAKIGAMLNKHGMPNKRTDNR